MGQRPAPGAAQELLACGPFLGIDASTDPVFVDPLHAADSINILPNKTFGGFNTILGRQHAFAGNFPSQLYGFTKWSRVSLSDVYVAGVNVAGNEVIYASFLGGSPGAQSMPSGVTWSTPGETSFVPYQQWLFITNGSGTPIKYDTSFNATRWGITAPGAPTVAPTSGALMVGTYYYIVTFFNAFQESSAGTTSASVTVVNQAVALSNIPVSTDPQVTGRNIYRFGGVMQNIQLVGTIADNTTTTFTDTVLDTAVTGQTLVQYRDPPQAFFAICSHQGRIFGFGYSGTAVGEPSSIQGTSDLWYSNFEEPWGFNSVNQVLPIGRNAGGDIGVEVVSYMNVLYCLKAKSFWAVYGSTPSDYTQLQLFKIGCASKKSVVQAFNLLFWATPEKSIVMFNGAQVTDISDNRTTGAKSSIKGVLETFSLADMQAVTAFPYDQGIVFSFPTQGISYFYNIPDGQWYKLSASTDRAVYDTENANEVQAAEVGTGTVDTWFTSQTDLGGSITGTYVSRISDSNSGHTTKRYRYVNLVAPVQSATVTITTAVNPGLAALSNTQSISLAVPPEKHVVSLPPTVGSGQVAQLTIAVTTTQQASIYRAGLYGWIERQFIPTG